MNKRELLQLIKTLMASREAVEINLTEFETLKKMELVRLQVRLSELNDEIETLIPIYRKLCREDKQ